MSNLACQHYHDSRRYVVESAIVNERMGRVGNSSGNSSGNSQNLDGFFHFSPGCFGRLISNLVVGYDSFFLGLRSKR